MFPLLSAVFIGGGVGSVLRWWLGVKLNSATMTLPWGTLSVNLLGALIIGLAIALFARIPQLDPAWKLLITTGFCGGLTTFSTFSAEVVSMMLNGQLIWAGVTIVCNLVGSLTLTLLGIGVVNWLAPQVPL